jgi:hypothetical protein
MSKITLCFFVRLDLHFSYSVVDLIGDNTDNRAANVESPVIDSEVKKHEVDEWEEDEEDVGENERYVDYNTLNRSMSLKRKAVLNGFNRFANFSRCLHMRQKSWFFNAYRTFRSTFCSSFCLCVCGSYGKSNQNKKTCSINNTGT